MTWEAALELEDVSFGYGSTPVLSQVSVTVPARTFCVITGPSGCGKSTLLSIAGLLLTPDRGSVRHGGIPTPAVGDPAADVLRSRLGFVFQRFHLVPYKSALGNVESGLAWSPMDRRERRDRSMAAMARVGLPERLALRRPGDLSGGEAQRVAIARAIVRQPDLLLCDEPTGSLDSENSAAVTTILRDLATVTTVVVVSHDHVLSATADQRVALLDGRVVGDTVTVGGS